MKKKVYLSIVIFLIISSCTNDFLELYPETSLNEGVFYKTEENFINGTNGCYIAMRNNYKTNQWALTELKSDNASFQRPNDFGGWSRYDNIQFRLTSVNPIYLSFWRRSYSGITNINKMLDELEKQDIKWSNGIKERCFGEILFLRALYYFDLVRLYGGVPLVLKFITPQEALDIPRSSENDVYQIIIKDLKESITYFSEATAVEENGRANWGSAASLLGKVYLTLHEFPNAESILKSVIDLGKYSLLSNYADLFNPANKDYTETIFSIQFSESTSETSNRFLFYFVPWTSKGEITNRPNVNIIGSGWNQPTEDLINAFEEGDMRREVSIGFWTGPDFDSSIKTFPYCKKYKAPISSPINYCGDNFPVIRYSDILLMYAEVLNEQGRTSEAIPYVEQVRTRAGLTEPLTGYNKGSLEALIAHERQVEFCFENQRWFDLLRTGKALDVLTEHGIREMALRPWLQLNAYIMQEYKLIGPIPHDEIILSHVLEQNPGYN